ncbi:hypothetical protein G6F57_010710 [Rhizopus arrhizus]|uniref:Kaptin n=1 Tax=Rhizopus oryzae TaxID=64495 RepID=A0A9P7BLS4_RHIOR|nr:hypothetical protein G6F23_009404 [Rhizopus arrhizus]KAG0755616.1 hypothetical protein G6F24_011713 [Rhizopus arrhizus]KAG0781694.1 hypothetical protein G6F21_011512 [Rhizopus arrhizus]KAG0784813.1 hypothetical protein G6F22_008171 [Rhizopus arrhizus]KAG0805757.1 hypothetical protein G6F20_011652 [Rhizopus arrhizus]
MSFNDPSNTDDNLLFDETHYARYGYERTNIYGLVTLDSRLLTYIDRPEEFPSTRYDKLPDVPTTECAQLLPKPVRHFIAASSSELTAFISRDGYWNCLNIFLGLEAGRSEVIAIDAVEETIDGKIKILLALAVAEKVETENEEISLSYSLRIYGNALNTKPFLEQVLFDIKESSQVIPLSAAPMQITHVQVNYEGKTQIAFMLTSMDHIVHFYIQDSQLGQFIELSSSTFFPMMGRISEHKINILFTHIFNQSDGAKVICAGGQSGEIFLGFYDKDGKETKTNATRIFSPITSVLLFQPRTYSQSDELHLIITCAIEQAIVYRHIETNGLTTSRALPLSGSFDSVLCSHVMDVDWDGEREILIGTYGRQVLIYKQVAGTQVYNILWKRQFAYPIYRIAHLDLNRDGLDELIVTTMYGVHIFQPNMKKARDRLLEALQYVESTKRRKYELLIEWRHRKELEKSIVFER